MILAAVQAALWAIRVFGVSRVIPAEVGGKFHVSWFLRVPARVGANRHA